MGLDRREFMRKGLAIAGAGFMTPTMISFLDACANTSSSTPTKLPSALRIGEAGLSDQIMDPGQGILSNQPRFDLLYDFFIGVDESGLPAKGKGVAQDWAITSNGPGQTYTIKIHQGIKFSNGDDLTSADVKFSLDRVIAASPVHKTGARTALINLIASIDAPDPYTIVINTKGPSATLLPLLSRSADSAGYIQPQKYFQAHGPDYFAAHPVGSGAYVLTDNQNGAQMKFQAASGPHWLTGKQRFQTITWLVRSEESVLLAGLQTGELDVVPISGLAASTLNDPKLAVVRSRGANDAELLPRTTSRGQINDIRVRQALCLAMDRESIAKKIFLNNAVPKTGDLWPTSALGYSKFPPLPEYAYDPQQAKSLLNQAYPQGVSVTVVDYQQPEYPEQTNFALAVADMWRAVGVHVTNRTLDRITYVGLMVQDKFTDTFTHGGGSNRPLAAISFLSTDFRSTSPYTVAKDAKLDQLINAVFASADLAAFEANVYAAAKYEHENYYLMDGASIDTLYVGLKDVVSGWEPNKLGRSEELDTLGLVTEKPLG